MNNISLLDGLLKLVCLLMVYSYKYFIMHLPAECRYFFWWNMFFKNRFSFTGIINPFPLLNTFSFFFFFFDFFTYQLDFSDLRFNLIHSKLLNLLKSHTFFTDALTEKFVSSSSQTLHKMCQETVFFWPVFYRIRENVDQKKHIFCLASSSVT